MIGRPRNSSPKTAYDVRRYMTLVQVIASTTEAFARREALGRLIVEWEVVLPNVPYVALKTEDLITILARYVVNYHLDNPSLGQ